MCQVGYTCGAHHDPQLGWARNLLGNQSGTAVDQLLYKSSSVFALFWNICQNQLPGEVLEDFTSWLQQNQMVRMHTMGAQDTTKGIYTVKYGEDAFEFHGAEMSPPSGVFATNYSRFVRDW